MAKQAPTVEIFQAYITRTKEGYYWRLRAKNGQIVAIGGEGYATEAKAKRGFRTAQRLIAQVQGPE